MSKLTEAIEPLINRIGDLTKVQRYAIFIGSIVVIIGLFVWLGVMPKQKKISELSTKSDKLTKQLNEVKTKAKDLDKVKQQLEEAKIQFEVVKKTLPEEKDIPSLLENITGSGRDSGLEFALFKPLPERMMDFYAEIPVDIRVEGHYHSLAVFFEKVGKLPRIVNIRDISMKPTKGSSGKLETACKAVTYRFVDKPPETPKGKGRPQRGQPKK